MPPLPAPPAYGAKALQFDEKAALAVKGVEKVVDTPRGITVIADTLHAAWKGRQALQVKWDKGSHPDMNTESVEKHYRDGLDKPGAVVVKSPDTAKALAEAAKKVEAVYYVPFVAHATMEPMNCTAYVQKDRCDVWVPTQAQTLTQMVASKISGLPPDKVFVHTTLLGCGLGRRARPEFVEEAVVASKAAGKPVKVIWSREEDMKYDYYRATTCQRLVAGLDSQGSLTGWSQKVSCTSILRFSNPAGIKDGVDVYSLWGIYDYEKTPTFSHTAYEIPNWYLEQYLSDLPILQPPGARCRTRPMPLSWSPSWTSLPMLQEKIPLPSAWSFSRTTCGPPGCSPPWRRRRAGGNPCPRAKVAASLSTPASAASWPWWRTCQWQRTGRSR